MTSSRKSIVNFSQHYELKTLLTFLIHSIDLCINYDGDILKSHFKSPFSAAKVVELE